MYDKSIKQAFEDMDSVIDVFIQQIEVFTKELKDFNQQFETPVRKSEETKHR